MAGNIPEVLISGEKRQIVADTKLRYERVDCPGLHANPSARIAQRGRCNVVVAIRNEKWQRREVLEYLIPGFGSYKTLEQFLEHQTRRDHRLALRERVVQRGHVNAVALSVAAKGQRPDAGICEESHPRDRSDL